MPTTTACSAITRSVKERGKWMQKEEQRPSVIELYNQYMGGVDLADQRVRSYQRSTKMWVWYMKLFFLLFGGCHHGCIAWAKKPSPQPSSDNKVLLHACVQTWTYWQTHWRKSLQKKNNRKSATSSWIKRLNLQLGHFPVFFFTEQISLQSAYATCGHCLCLQCL